MSKNKETRQIQHFSRDEEVKAKYGLLLAISYLLAISSTTQIGISVLKNTALKNEIIIAFVIANISAALYGFLLKIPMHEFLARFWERAILITLFILIVASFKVNMVAS